MHINPRDTMAGVPMLAVRDLLGYTFPLHTLSAAAQMAAALAVDLPTADRLLTHLAVHGFIVSAPWPHPGWPGEIWQRTPLGDWLAGSSARLPIYRRTAVRLLGELLDRIAAVNADSTVDVTVTRALLFGSYLSDAPRLGDLDVYLKFTPRAAAVEPQAIFPVLHILQHRSTALHLHHGRQLARALTGPHVDLDLAGL